MSNLQRSRRQTLPIFVLTLTGSERRRASLLAALKSHELDYELFFGVDGRNGLPAQYEHLVDRSARVNNIRRPMTDGEYACALSHLLIYRQIVTRELRRALILEDDAIIGSFVADLACENIPAVGDLMLLDHDRGLFRRSGQMTIAPKLTAYRIAAAPDLTTGYVMTCRAAETLLREAFPVRHLADWPGRIDKLESYAIHPRIVTHPDVKTGPSELRSDRDRITEAAEHTKLPKPGKLKRLTSGARWKRKLLKKLHYQLDSRFLLDKVNSAYF